MEAGFDAQASRSDDSEDWWDCYNCVLNQNQYYNGTSQIYVPIIMDAVNARKTRFVNQIFPQSERYVEVVTEDGNMPDATISLLEYYIRKNRLRNSVMPALMKCGDVEGQYTIYVDWASTTKDVAWRVERPELIPLDIGTGVEGIEGDEDGIPDPTAMVMDIEEETITVGCPTVEIISDVDLLVLPFVADSIEEALEIGGSVTVIRRWTKATIKQMIAEGKIDKERGELLHAEMTSKSSSNRKDAAKQMSEAAGVKHDARGKHALVYETWTKMVVDGKKRIYKLYFAGEDLCLSCKRNPFWSDNIPVISCPVDKVKGSFKGKSKVAPVATFQYGANDIINEGMDSAAYAMLPIIMTDPEKNPNIGSLILSMAAVWQTSPKDTQFAQFPPLWKDAFALVGESRAQIFQSLSVNPASITQGSTSKKPTQAEIANEQQVDILTTADAVSVLEEGILTPMLHRMLELDHQYRDKEMTILQHGELGIKATMEKIAPTQLNKKHYIKWFGVESAKNAQQIQQQIAAVNVVRGIPPQMYQGYALDMVPLIKQLMENAFGPRLSPLIFKSIRDQLSVDPGTENQLLALGHDLPAHPLDNMQQHMQAHVKALQETGDPHGTILVHIMNHRMVSAMQPPDPNAGLPGSPGGAGPGLPGQPGPGAAGPGPQPGAQPSATRFQGPPGMISPDNMSDPTMMPR